MTRGTMRTMVRRRLMETTANHWSDSNVNDLIDLGIQAVQTMIMAIDPERFVFLYQRDIVADNDLYEWPVGMDYAYGVYLLNSSTGNYEPLEKVDSWRAIASNYAAEDDATTRYARLGQYVMLSPKPATTIANGLRIFFHPTLTAADDATVPLIPIRTHYLACLLAARFGLPQAGQDRDEIDKEIAPLVQEMPRWYRAGTTAPNQISLDLNKEY